MVDLAHGNLFAGLTSGVRDETFDILTRSPSIRIERIVSTGQASPPGFWYDQPGFEFVILLAGSARLRFEQESRAFDLKPGDWIDIPAHSRHRVDATQANPPTAWLVVHRTAA